MDNWTMGTDVEAPSLKLKSLGEGESIVITLPDKLEALKNHEGKDCLGCIVRDESDGISKKMLVPHAVSRNWDRIKGRTIFLTKGPLSGKSREWGIKLAEKGKVSKL